MCHFLGFDPLPPHIWCENLCKVSNKCFKTLSIDLWNDIVFGKPSLFLLLNRNVYFKTGKNRSVKKAKIPRHTFITPLKCHVLFEVLKNHNFIIFSK